MLLALGQVCTCNLKSGEHRAPKLIQLKKRRVATFYSTQSSGVPSRSKFASLITMKLGTLKSKENLDGIPLVVSRDNKWAVSVEKIIPSIRVALEKWESISPTLQDIYVRLNEGKVADKFKINEEDLHSVLPRTFLWADGSAFIQHIKLVRQARNAPLPETLHTVPLMYQGGGDSFLAPREDIPMIDFSHGVDFEGEVAVITDYVPMGTTANEALKHIKLFLLVNDVSLRGLIPTELAQGFGFFQSKPSSALSPFAITADELGSAWKDGRIHLPLLTEFNGKRFGAPNAGEMHFHFGQLIAHAARTRSLCAGTIIGSGTVSNEDPSRGGSCIAEKRMLEKINTGQITTQFMNVGDTVKIEMLNENNENLFGTIFQKVVQANIRE